MTTAPPTEPGIPWAKVMSPRLSSAMAWAMRLREKPAETSTSRRSTQRMGHSGARMTTPGKPSSATRRLLPLPMTA